MSKILNYFFNPLSSDENKKYSEMNNELGIATAALFLEAAYADENFSDEEKSLIIKMISQQFKLDENETNEILKLAEDKIKKSISFYEFTSILNRELTKEQKFEILKNIWRLLFSDKILSSHEEYFIRTIARNLRLEHKDFIAAKLEVKKELNL
ncbi:MAG: hypothetical protein Fur0015_12050 [Ignavibacteriales bacterium]